MKQIVQDRDSGDIELLEVPAPRVAPGHLLLHATCSVISGANGQVSARRGSETRDDGSHQGPGKVRRMLQRVHRDDAPISPGQTRGASDAPLTPGACSVGVVLQRGAGVQGFDNGDRVVCMAPQAEVMHVAEAMAVRLPDGVTDEAAAFAAVTATALQSVRLLRPTLGEVVLVIGLDLVGLLAVQILGAHGCRVLAAGDDPERLALARQFGADVLAPAVAHDLSEATRACTRGDGVDAALLTAAARDEALDGAACACRTHGRIVALGTGALDLSRIDFHDKALSFQVSSGYGAGPCRANAAGADDGFSPARARWSGRRNLQAALQLMARGQLQVAALVSHRIALAEAAKAWRVLADEDEAALGIVLRYPDTSNAVRGLRDQRIVALSSTVEAAPGKASVAFIGAGHYAGHVLIPAFSEAGASLHSIVSENGVSAVHLGKKHGFASAGTDTASALDAPEVDTAVIATRHDTHAMHVLAALEAGKHVFCERPLCLTLEEWEEVAGVLRKIYAPGSNPAARREAGLSPASAGTRTPMLMLGWNLRFAPQIVKIRQLLASLAEPRSLLMTVNAGAIAPQHWLQDKAVGGGRIVGEASQYIDLLRHLGGAPITSWQALALGRHPALDVSDDKASMLLRFENGSTATLAFLANGSKGFPKERLEVFCGGHVLQLQDFKQLQGWGWKGFSGSNLRHRDKGRLACIQAFVDAVKGGTPCPVALDEVLEIARISIEIQEHLAP